MMSDFNALLEQMASLQSRFEVLDAEEVKVREQLSSILNEKADIAAQRQVIRITAEQLFETTFGKPVEQPVPSAPVVSPAVRKPNNEIIVETSVPLMSGTGQGKPVVPREKEAIDALNGFSF